MCDILIATPKATENGVMLFAKNSDRDPNESQIIEYIPRMHHSEEKVKLTYVEFPQVEETNAIIISRPWWMYGAEMGANEYGVVIGNTAVFTKEPYNKIGITGMDMIRLALERTKSAREALDFIIKIIEEHGQGGSGSYEHEFYYHNSFIIADPKEAWVLETAGRFWVAKRIKSVYSISNGLTIGTDWDMASSDLVRYAKEKYKCNIKEEGFAKCFTSKLITYFARAKERREFTMSKLLEREGSITIEYFAEILRAHREEKFAPWKSSMKDICIHYKGTFTPSQTASAQISYLATDFQIHWFTGTSNTCLSIFKPFVFDVEPPSFGKKPTNKYDPETYWWKHEYLHRLFIGAYQKYFSDYRKEADEIEKKSFQGFPKKYLEFKKGNVPKEEIEKLINEILEKEENLRKKWTDKLRREGVKISGGFFFKRAWSRVNKAAGLRFS